MDYIGTSDPAGYKIYVNGTTFFNGRISHNTRYRPDDNLPCNKMNLWGSDGAYGFGSDGVTLDYFSGSTHRWFYGSGGTNYGNVALSVSGTINAGANLYATTYIDCGGTSGGYFKIMSGDSWVGFQTASGIHRDMALGTIYAHTDIYGCFTSVSMTGTDYLCIQQNTPYVGYDTGSVMIKSVYGSFTAFHRCYTDDVWYNGDTDQGLLSSLIG